MLVAWIAAFTLGPPTAGLSDMPCWRLPTSRRTTPRPFLFSRGPFPSGQTSAHGMFKENGPRRLASPLRSVSEHEHGGSTCMFVDGG